MKRLAFVFAVGVIAATLLAFTWESTAHAQAVVGPEFTVFSGNLSQATSGVGFDSVNQRFLVAIEQESSQVHAQLLAGDGSRIGDLFLLGGSYFREGRRSVAFDSINQRYFVIWEDINPFFGFGSLVAADGTVFSAGFQLPLPEGAEGAIAFDATTQRYLVVWREIVGRDLFGQLFAPDGSAIGGSFVIAHTTCGFFEGSLAYDTVRSQFLVTWGECAFIPSGLTTVIRAQYVSGAGDLVGSTIAIPRPGDVFCNPIPAVAPDPTRGRFLEVWLECTQQPGTGPLFGRLMNSDGTPPGPAFRISEADEISSPNTTLRPDVFFDKAADKFAVFFNVGQNIHVQLVDAEGNLVGTNTPVGFGDHTRLAHDSINHRVLVAYSRSAPPPPSDDVFGRFVTLVVNQPPVAEAGADQAVACTRVSGTQAVLNGSGSSDPDGDSLTYTWTGSFPEGGGTATGVSPIVTLGLGTSTITLVVNDGQVDSGPDTVDITVAVGVQGLQPPLLALVPDGEAVLLPDKAFKQGRTLPLRLQLFCGAMALTDTDVAAPRIVSLVREGDAINLETIDPDAGEANDNGLLFRYSEPNWVYNLSTQGLSAGTYVVTIEMPDGLRYTAGFVLR